MLKDLVHSTPYLHQRRLEAIETGGTPRPVHPVRNALGRRLIALGMRLIDTTGGEREPLNTPA
jgi:hypothetical protein